ADARKRDVQLFAMTAFLPLGAARLAGSLLGSLAGRLLLEQPPRAFLGELSLGEITGNFHVAAHRTRAIAQRRDDGIGPEAGAILAHAPVLVLAAAAGGSLAQFVVGPACLHRLRRVEAGEMLADDFLGF